ncbi:hypothetical protein B4U79_16934 [Dinothrombium tinctorium]|nr:hypothetical protein B4U79_16934 [Dinothrombium tinctorium]
MATSEEKDFESEYNLMVMQQDFNIKSLSKCICCNELINPGDSQFMVDCTHLLCKECGLRHDEIIGKYCSLCFWVITAVLPHPITKESDKLALRRNIEDMILFGMDATPWKSTLAKLEKITLATFPIKEISERWSYILQSAIVRKYENYN